MDPRTASSTELPHVSKIPILHGPAPRLMFATAGPEVWFPVTQSMPAATVDRLPEPPQSSTRTATSVTFLATPYVDPPTVPATCVPWPLQSSGLPSLSM